MKLKYFLIVLLFLLMSLSIAHRGYVMESGRVTLSGDAQQLKNNPEVINAYLGGEVKSG